jgi:hypothetical protein
LNPSRILPTQRDDPEVQRAVARFAASRELGVARLAALADQGGSPA